MRRIIISLFALGLAVAPASVTAEAQEAPRTGARRSMQRPDPVARIIAQRAELELTEDQVQRLEAIRSRLEEQNRPLLEQVHAQMGEVRGQRRANRLAPANGMMAERRAELRERWEQMTEEEREQHRNEMRERLRERRESMTEEEREALRQQMQERRAEMRERMEALRPTMQQLRENQRQALAEVREVLTEEQQSKLREMREQRMKERGERPGRRHRRGEGTQPQSR